MAKEKGKAYDMGDILGIKEPADAPGEKKPAPKAKAPKPKKAKSKTASKPAGDKLTPYRQKRDKRLQVVIPQNLYDALKDEATDAGVSVNEVVNVLLANGLKKRG